MAYMDVPSGNPNGQTFILFHGKNFNGFYWKRVIAVLNNQGYRVIVPDQVGWGKSDKPDIHSYLPAAVFKTKIVKYLDQR